MYELIIAEKPAAANKIATALAEGKAIKENIPFSQRALSIEKDLKFMDEELYRNGKSLRGCLKSPF